MAVTPVYNDDSIQTLTDLQHIRLRSSGYIPDTGILGLHQLGKELIDNSIDECSLQPGTGIVDIVLFKNHDHMNYQMVVIDNGRGIPVAKLVDVFATTKTSGKFNTTAYKYSAGTFGIGSSVVVALSNWFRAITKNVNLIGDAIIRYDNIPTEVSTLTNHNGSTGTLVMYEPDSEIFQNISEFIIDYSKLIEYLIQLSLYGNYRIRLFTYDDNMPTEIRNGSALQVLDFFDKLTTETSPEYDSVSLDRPGYIRGFFGIQKNWDMIIPISGTDKSDTLHISGEVLISLNNINTSNNRLTFVNNILFTDQGSLHISLMIRYIKEAIAPLIADKNVRKFFVENYKIPIWLVLDVKFAGCQFAGMTKHSMKDLAIISPYNTLLTKMLPPDIIHNLYTLLTEHIQVNFDKFSNSGFKTTTNRGLLSMLNRPEKFNNCSTTDREKAELFLVEGDSAKSDQDRDSRFQASYTLGGKPFNGLTTIDKLSESSNNIKKNPIFQDIIRILNITPGSTDLTKLNFGKMMIMSDADTHGYHIANIIIGNMYALCPRMIEDGKIFVVNPPLYGLTIKGADTIYIKNELELNTTLAYHVYYRCIDIAIKSDRYDHILTREEFVAFSELVIKIGDELDRLAQEYMIPSVLLEQLALMTNHLRIDNPDVEELQKWLGCDVRYVPSSNILVISMGSDDIIVPLTQITDLIYSRILPLYREFYYGKTRLYVTTKNSKALINSPSTIIQIHEIFKRLSDLFKIERYKGLGSMDSKDRAMTCTNQKTRRIRQVTSVGDVKMIFNMLGSDPNSRKKLISG